MPTLRTEYDRTIEPAGHMLDHVEFVTRDGELHMEMVWAPKTDAPITENDLPF